MKDTVAPPWRASWRAAGLAAGLQLGDFARLPFAELIQIIHAAQVASGARRRWRNALARETEGLRKRFDLLQDDAKKWPLDSTLKSDLTRARLNEDSPPSLNERKDSTGGWAIFPEPR